ncbi:hypothetical protein, partial [Rhizobium favelukesii]
GRLFLGIGGRDHFGIRGRIASEFARVPPDAARTFEDAPRAASAKRSRALPLMPKFSEERRYLHMHSAARQILAAE